jgi:hypothetical protein
MATYLRVPYHAGLGPDGNEVTLFSPDPPPDELGFTAAAGHWRKQVSTTDLDALWQSRLVGEYRGEPCLVLDDLGDRLHIACLGRDSARARQLGYWEIDREVFEVVVPRQDIAGLAEERVEYPLASAMFPPSNRDAVTQARPEARKPGTGPPLPAAERTSPLRVVPRPGPQPGHGRGDRASSTPDRMAAWHGSPDTEPWSEPARPASLGEPRADPRINPRRDPRSDPRPDPRQEPRQDLGSDPRPVPRMEARPAYAPGTPGAQEPRAGPMPGPPPGAPPARRAGRRERVPQSVFAELLSLAGIPHTAYAVDEEVPGAMCLVKADGGFEVFSRTDDARLDVRFFEDEEAAYFYLFGVLAAEAVRSGRLRPGPANGYVNGSRGPGLPVPPAENVSKYLRGKKLPKQVPHPVIVD